MVGEKGISAPHMAHIVDFYHRRGQPLNLPWNFGLAPQGAGLLRGSVLRRDPQSGSVFQGSDIYPSQLFGLLGAGRGREEGRREGGREGGKGEEEEEEDEDEEEDRPFDLLELGGGRRRRKINPLVFY